ncbi:MAG: hypothetical protein RL219_1760 [Actinomycetota bacterium]|jgi:hypothetical protein
MHAHPPRRSRRRTGTPTLHHADAALDLVSTLLTEPRCHEVLCLLLDDAARVHAVLVFEGQQPPEDIVLTADTVLHLTVDARVDAVVLVSVRPGAPFSPADLARWRALNDLFAETHLALLEWFVADEHTMVAVSACVGERARWPSPDG